MSEPDTPQSAEAESVTRQKALERLIRQITKESGSTKGAVRRLWEQILNLFSSGPRREVAHDWLVTHSLADEAKARLFCATSAEPGSMHALATVHAYLDLARRERDFAQAWSYINLADASLPLVLDREEVEACRSRLAATDCFIPDDLRKQLDLSLKPGGAPANGGTPSKHRPDRHEVHSEQLTRSLFWNVANRAVSLKLALWREVGIWLLMGLVAAIAVATVVTSQETFYAKPYVYLEIALLGFFGGGLSSVLKARQAVIDIQHYGLVKSYTFLRMLLGAAGAVVLYIAVQWPGLLADSLLKLIRTNPYVFLSIGIVAGFSERLFIETLDDLAKKFSKEKELPAGAGITSPGKANGNPTGAGSESLTAAPTR